MRRPMLFGMHLPVGPMCCGRATALFRQEPVAGDDSKTRQHFRCSLCHGTLEVIAGADDRPAGPAGTPFCPHCGGDLAAHYVRK